MKSRTLLLICPGNPWFISFSPCLTLGYVAAATPAGWKIKILDENMEKMDFSKVTPDLVGITAMTPQARRGYEIARIFRKRNIPVVMGGVHVSMLPDEALEHADAVVVGEAEPVWPQLISDFLAGRMKKKYESHTFMDLDALPTPRRDLFKGLYPFDIIKTTRGCPFNCDFCCIAAFHGARYRQRSVAAVIQELKQIRNRFIFFADDNIVGSGRKADDERAMALFQGMIDAGIKKTWMSQASINVVKNPDLLALMRKSGCRALLLGFESVELATLKGRGKVQNLKARDMAAYYRQVIDTLHRYGIAVNGFFFNGPWDSRETIRNMGAFLEETDIDLVTHTYLTPLPGTRLFNHLKGNLCEKDFPKDWDKYDYSRMVIQPEQMSLKAFYKERQAMVKKTHSWKRILRVTVKGLVRSRNPLVGLFILSVNLIQKRSYHREHIRNLKEL